MHYLLLFLSMFACLFGNVTKKMFGNRYADNAPMYHFYNAGISLVAAFLLSALIGFRFEKVSRFTLLVGLLFGTVVALQAIFYMMAVEKGPFSYSSVLVSLSMIIPTLSGFLIWDEPIVPVQIIGIALMVICFLCSVDRSKSERKTTLVWFFYVGAAFLMNGLIGVLQKWHQNSPYREELDEFLIIAFVVSALFSGLAMLVLSGKAEKKDKPKPDSRRIFSIAALVVIGGVCIAANHKINLYLSGVMDSAVFFPTVNGGGLILTTVASVLLFRERPTRRQWIGIGIGLISVILLCNPF